MKKYKYKILIFLFNFLSKFALSFKPKNTLMYKSSIVNSINAYINSYFQKDFGNFDIQSGILVASNMETHKIQYLITDPKGFKFEVFLSYDSGIIKKTIIISSCESIDHANNFFNYFLKDDFDFTSLFQQLTSAV